MTMMNLGRDFSGGPMFSPQFCEDSFSTVLLANVAQTFTVPSTAAKWVAVFSYQSGSTVQVRLNAAAANATGSVTLVPQQEMSPVSRFVKAGDTISMITPDTQATVGVQFYVYQQTV